MRSYLLGKIGRTCRSSVSRLVFAAFVSAPLTPLFAQDVTPPDSRAIYPVGLVTSVLAVTGTARDPLPGELLGSDVVRIALRRISNPRVCYENNSETYDHWIPCPIGTYPNDRLWFSTGTISDPLGQPGYWSWDSSLVHWENMASYDLQAVAVDKAGNLRTYPGANSPDIVFDYTIPSADTEITIPATEKGYYDGKSVVSLAGEAYNVRIFRSIQVRLKRLTEPAAWWNEDSKTWVQTDTYTYVTAAGGAWLWNISGAEAFTVDGTSYTFTSTGFNPANEAEAPPTSRTIIVDNTRPLGAVLSPNTPYINSMPVISGTAVDPGRGELPGGSLARVLVMIKETNLGNYWNGVTFTGFMQSSEIPAASTLNWSTATAVNPALRDGRRYTVYVRPEDKAGNSEYNEQYMPSYSVIYDTSSPDSRVSLPVSLASITGTASDPDGVYAPNQKSDLARVELQIYDATNNKWWHDGSGAFTAVSSSFSMVSGTAVWSYTNPSLAAAVQPDVSYIIRSRAVDKAGNIQLADNVSSVSYTLGNTQAVIKVPQNGMRVSGNSVTVVAEVLTGTEADTREVKLQYKEAASDLWLDIPARDPDRHPNPDATAPYFIHWDVTGLAAGDYSLRAVVTDLVEAPDLTPAGITVTMGAAGNDINENSSGGRVTKEQTVSNLVSNMLQTAAPDTGQLTSLEIPPGALQASTAAVGVTNNPPQIPPYPGDAEAAGGVVEIVLSNQSTLAGGVKAAVSLTFPDANNDGIVDGTALRASRLEMYSAHSIAGPWERDLASVVDLAGKQVTGYTTHFSFFALFVPRALNINSVRAYPLPWRPGSGGKFDSALGTNGITFDNLTDKTEIRIYTIMGQLVRELKLTAADLGVKVWDGRNSDGRKAASGVYLAHIRSGSSVKILKIAVER